VTGRQTNGAPPPQLVGAAAHAASANVSLVADSLRSAADALGRGDWRTGRCLMAQGTTTVRTLVLVTDMLASIPGVDAARRSGIDVVLMCVRATLTALESKRLRGDWDGVIGILDQDMASLLGEWSNELDTIGGESSLRPTSAHALEPGRVRLDLLEAR
jgi:hypothetical protein